MRLADLLNTLKIGTNHCSVNLIENLKDCKRINVMIRREVFDRDKFKNWCKENRIIYGKVEFNNELVYRLDRFN